MESGVLARLRVISLVGTVRLLDNQSYDITGQGDNDRGDTGRTSNTGIALVCLENRAFGSCCGGSHGVTQTA